MKDKTRCSWIISFAMSSCIKSLTFQLQLSTLLPIHQSFWDKVWTLLAFYERKEVGVFWLFFQDLYPPIGCLATHGPSPNLEACSNFYRTVRQMFLGDAKLMAKGWRDDHSNLLPSRVQLGVCSFGHLIWRSQNQNESRIEPVLLCSHTWT